MHEQWQEQIPFYVAGTLAADEVTALESHLAGCNDCRREVEQWRLIADAAWHQADAWSKPLPPLSAAVRDNLKRKPAYTNGFKETGLPADPEYQVTYLRPERKAHVRRGVNRSPVTLAAAMFIVLVLGGIVLVMLNQGTTPPEAGFLGSGGTVETLDQQHPDDPSPTRRVSPTVTPSPTRTNSDLGILPVASPTITLSPVPTLIDSAEPDSSLCSVTSATGGAINVYRGPNANYPITTQLQPDEFLYTWVKEGTWYQIGGQGRGLVGWVPGSQVTLSGTCSNLPAPSPTRLPPVDGPTPTAQYLEGAFNQFSLITTQAVGPYAANTALRVNYAFYTNGQWTYGVEARDGTQSEILEQYVTYMPGFDPSAPIPTAVFYHELGMGTYNAVLVKDVGLFKTGTHVRLGSATYDGVEWIYTIAADDNVTYAEAPESALAYEPGYVPGPTATHTPSSLPNSLDVEAAYQSFQNGHMIWRGDTGEIYALSSNGQVFRYGEADYGAKPENPITDTPPAGYVKPISGFGRVWGNYKSVRDGLGWGLTAEAGYTATIESGDTYITVTLPDGRAATIFSNNTWQMAD